MNKNIEVINENLLAVNFEHINAGLIKEITFDSENCSDYASLTKDGKILLNKNDSMYQKNLTLIQEIMQLTDEQLNSEKGLYEVMRKIFKPFQKLSNEEIDKFIKENGFEKAIHFYYSFFQLEKQRRIYQNNSDKHQKSSFNLKRLFNRKVGEVKNG